jgi:hypothetical protein
MSSAKPVVSMHVRPFQVSHLCFEVDGIIGESDTHLGATVAPFDFAAFYTALSSAPTVSGDLSRLLYDPAKIRAFVGPSALVALRAEAGKAALTNAINARQNAYFSKYGNAAAIINTTNQFYSPGVAGSKPDRLATLSKLSDQQANALQAAYLNDGKDGVVKTTNSVLTSFTESGEESKEQSSGQTKEQSSGSTTETGQTMDETFQVPSVVGNFPGPPPAGQFISWSVDEPINWNIDESTNTSSTKSSGVATTQSTGSQSSQGTGYALQSQTILNTDYGYRMPKIESQAQNERAQISLIDQRYAQFMFAQNLPNLAQVFQNETRSTTTSSSSSSPT